MAWPKQHWRFDRGALVHALAPGHSGRKAIQRIAGKPFEAIPLRRVLCSGSIRSKEFWPLFEDSSAAKLAASWPVIVALARSAIVPLQDTL
jgi:hypothetical protein